MLYFSRELQEQRYDTVPSVMQCYSGDDIICATFALGGEELELTESS